MLVYKLLPEIKAYIESGQEKDFSEQLDKAKSEILIKLTCILQKESHYLEIIDELKEDRRFGQTINNSFVLITLISSSEYVNLLSVTNIILLLIIASTLTILNFYIIQNTSVFEQQMTIIKNCIFNYKLELPTFRDFVCSKFNSIFSNLAKLESTIIQARNKIMTENFNMQHKKQCIQDFMLYIEQPLKQLYECVVDCLLEKQESVLKDITLFIKHINDYFKWFIDKVKETVRYLIERYNNIAREQDIDLEVEFDGDRDSSCNIIADWLATKWELWFYNRKSQAAQQLVVEHPLKGNSFNDIIRQRAASCNKITP